MLEQNSFINNAWLATGLLTHNVKMRFAGESLISELIVLGRKCVKMFNWVKVNDGWGGR